MSQRDMDLNELVIFARVIQAGNFSKAGRALGLPKSTLSRKVSALETHLGVTLVQRTTRALALTEAGQELYNRCRQIVVQIEEAQAIASRQNEAPHGTLRVTAPALFGTVYVAEYLGEFLSSNQGLDAQLYLSDPLVDLVAEGFDLGIRIGPLEDTSFVARKLGEMRFCYFASQGYLSKAGEPRTLKELGRHRLLRFGRHGAADTEWESLLSGDSHSEKGALLCNNYLALKSAALAGAGIAFLPEYVCSDDLKSGALKRVLDRESSSPLPVWAVFTRQRYLAPKVRAFVEHLAERSRAARWNVQAKSV